MVFTTFASDLLSCLLHLYSLVNLSKSIFSSSTRTECKYFASTRLSRLIPWHPLRFMSVASDLPLNVKFILCHVCYFEVLVSQ